MNARNNSGRNRGNKKKQQNKKKKAKVDPKKFWGDPEALPSPEGFEISTPDPVAVVNSLGQPPLPGHGAASPHYFKLVYGRSTQIAGALAMAGEIDDLTPDPLPEPEEALDDELGEEGNVADEANTVDDELGHGNEVAPAEASSDEELSGNEAATDESE